MANIDKDAPGSTQLLMGNEAIARGALEAGVRFASGYPGTPSSEIIDSLAPIGKQTGVYVEWSVNEMVALEAAAGASFAGLRAITSMKENGFNVVSDFVATLILSGIGKGGLVLVVCDDPGAFYSAVDQDTRPAAKWLDVPLLEPGTFQEAKDMTKWLFSLAEELDSMCMLRSVTRISHSRGNVTLGELPKTQQSKAYFDQVHDLRNVKQTKYVTSPVLINHAAQHRKLEKAREIFESSEYNWYQGPDQAELLIITSGSGWLHSRSVVKELQLEKKIGILKLGTIWPLPNRLVEKCINKSNKVLFVEEVDPFLEGSIMEFVAGLPPNASRPIFYGKHSGHISSCGELTPNMITDAITNILGIALQSGDNDYREKTTAVSKNYLPNRDFAFCPGCPHRASLWAIKNALKLDGREGILTGDAGCYGMAGGPTGFYQIRLGYCMGANGGMATGLGSLEKFGFSQPVLAMCGDGTFYHATIPSLINGVWNKSNYIQIILENNTTAMTGFQPHAGVGRIAMGDEGAIVELEALCRSIGAHVEVCDPFAIKSTTETLLKMMGEGNGVKVVIMRRECELIRGRKEKHPYKVFVDTTKCIGEDCGCNRLCTRVFRCPGLSWDRENGKAKIDEVICAGCGVCTQMCPQGAIVKEAI
ncbi:MAG: thiamine pyrophosphate-dependent enzyme [Dehalococcoidales bacterium]|nr:thiamine pyrophosphate-dependent enzyme [Dehalococcoidales bacterium]